MTWRLENTPFLLSLPFFVSPLDLGMRRLPSVLPHPSFCSCLCNLQALVVKGVMVPGYPSPKERKNTHTHTQNPSSA